MAAAFGEDNESASSDVTDDELVGRVAMGDKQAFAMLYERHVDAARAYARVLVGSWQQVDDLVAESFVKIFDRMTVGRGQVSAFRAYLIATVRTTFYKRSAVEKRYSHCDEFDEVASDEQGMSERVVDKLDFELASKAFASLPERWQHVLWLLEVQQQSTEAVGETLGIKANAVSALAFRARDGLRLAYLQLHISGLRPAECRKPASELARWLCGRLARAERARVAEHLEGCAACRDAVTELTDLLNQMRRFVSAVPRPVSPAEEIVRPPRSRKLAGLGVLALAAGFALLWSVKAVGPVLAHIDDAEFAAPVLGGTSWGARQPGGGANAARPAPDAEVDAVVTRRSAVTSSTSAWIALSVPAAQPVLATSTPTAPGVRPVSPSPEPVPVGAHSEAKSMPDGHVEVEEAGMPVAEAPSTSAEAPVVPGEICDGGVSVELAGGIVVVSPLKLGSDPDADQSADSQAATAEQPSAA
ncbi:sigma-70 family RNA polymerase sigma factor [Lentzea sp. E54]|uniref:sigma-70 family RNA polymerase sigma factor n=1 Tax=Lentzea xerophila TaxID=3435883 RepID=UPI003DA3A20E